MKSLSVTFTYVFVSVPLKLIAALAVAMLLNQKLRGVAFYRAVYYIPTLLGGSVAIAVLSMNSSLPIPNLLKQSKVGYYC